jgi:hypothetical protein
MLFGGGGKAQCAHSLHHLLVHRSRSTHPHTHTHTHTHLFAHRWRNNSINIVLALHCRLMAELEESLDLTLRPDVEASSRMYPSVQPRISLQNPERNLALWRTKQALLEAKRAQYRREQEEREMAECTFRPAVTPLPEYLFAPEEEAALEEEEVEEEEERPQRRGRTTERAAGRAAEAASSGAAEQQQQQQRPAQARAPPSPQNSFSFHRSAPEHAAAPQHHPSPPAAQPLQPPRLHPPEPVRELLPPAPPPQPRPRPPVPAAPKPGPAPPMPAAAAVATVLSSPAAWKPTALGNLSDPTESDTVQQALKLLADLDQYLGSQEPPVLLQQGPDGSGSPTSDSNHRSPDHLAGYERWSLSPSHRAAPEGEHSPSHTDPYKQGYLEGLVAYMAATMRIQNTIAYAYRSYIHLENTSLTQRAHTHTPRRHFSHTQQKKHSHLAPTRLRHGSEKCHPPPAFRSRTYHGIEIACARHKRGLHDEGQKHSRDTSLLSPSNSRPSFTPLSLFCFPDSLALLCASLLTSLFHIVITQT